MTHLFLMIGTSELLLIGAVVLLLFGGKKLPEMMKGLGQGIKSFKQGMNEPLGESNDNNVSDNAKAEQNTAQTTQAENQTAEKKDTAEEKEDSNVAKK